MAAEVQVRTSRQATPERWQKALARAIDEKVEVRQLADSGAWVATSGTDATVAYLIEVTGDVAHGCACQAGQHGDPVCKHRAMFYHLIGVLDPEPDPPAPTLAPVPCWACAGVPGGCPVCGGAGRAPLDRQVAALLAAAA